MARQSLCHLHPRASVLQPPERQTQVPPAPGAHGWPGPTGRPPSRCTEMGTVSGAPAARGIGPIHVLSYSMERGAGRGRKKPLNQSDVRGRGQEPDDGLLVTHVNQTQDLLVRTAVLYRGRGGDDQVREGTGCPLWASPLFTGGPRRRRDLVSIGLQPCTFRND